MTTMQQEIAVAPATIGSEGQVHAALTACLLAADSGRRALASLATVHVRIGGGHAIFEATNRYVAVQASWDADWPDGRALEALISIADAKRLLPLLVRRDRASVSLAQTGSLLTLTTAAGAAAVGTVDGQYPNLARLIADALEREPVAMDRLTIDPAWLAVLAKMPRDQGSRPTLELHGDHPAVVRWEHDDVGFVFMVMPAWGGDEA